MTGVTNLESNNDPKASYAVSRRGPLRAEIRPPGSRSITNRALLCAALAPPGSILRGITESDDVNAMADGLTTLGVKIVKNSPGWKVEGLSGHFPSSGVTINVGASGTAARFLTAASCLAHGNIFLTGTERMKERPIQGLTNTLAALGAELTVTGDNGCPPVQIIGSNLTGGRATVETNLSSQFLSAILLCAPCAQKDIELIFSSKSIVSRPFLELTYQVMSSFGAHFSVHKTGVKVKARGYQAIDYPIEPDAQSAVYVFCAAAIAGGSTRVLGIPGTSDQTDLRILEILERMGCRIQRDPSSILVERSKGNLKGIDVDMNDAPDAVLALSVVALFAEGPTTIRNIANLKIKETNRLLALENEIRRLGAKAVAGDDFIRIEPKPLHHAEVQTYDDHRMAMSFALAGLKVPGIRISNPNCVTKTWPDYFDFLENLETDSP